MPEQPKDEQPNDERRLAAVQNVLRDGARYGAATIATGPSASLLLGLRRRRLVLGQWKRPYVPQPVEARYRITVLRLSKRREGRDQTATAALCGRSS